MMNSSNIGNNHNRSFDEDWHSFSDNAFSAGEENMGPPLPLPSSPAKTTSSSVVDCSFALPSPSKSRAFGDVMQSNCIIDIASLKTVNSCDASLPSAVPSDVVSTAAASDCGTETSSVAHLRGWLNGFGKQHQEHYTRTSVAGKPPAHVPLEKPVRPKVQPSVDAKAPTPLPYIAASKLAKRIDSSKSDPAFKVRLKPVSYKPSIPKEDVQATDEGYASVAKLSAWLADDPTKTKKIKPIRRGANVIAKSKQFDKDLENVVFEEKVVPRANVANRKVWLEKRASMSSDKTEEPLYAASSTAKLTHIKPAIASETETDDSVMLLSVSEKKKWLSHAFDKQKSSLPVKKSQKRDTQDATLSSAKKMWRSTDNPPEQTYESSFSASVSSECADVSAIFRNASAESYAVQEEEPPVDFQAARRLLVERSKANGNDVEVVSKVQKRTSKFEKLDKESRRKSMSGPHTLLKSSWEEAESGRRSSYVKKYVPDVCPKKSFEQLP